ncbi:MAG: hypothetical protein K9W44_13190 [Candidatus Lokiarchaeota archaeon]|nr:hypothetical protein [Candidatus Harpocratesius repetitus]
MHHDQLDGEFIENIEIDSAKIINNRKFLRRYFTGCRFNPKKVDLSHLIDLREIIIGGCDLEEIIAWPPKIEKINIYKSPNLKRIPEDPSQYRFLKEFVVRGLHIENMDIDFSQSEHVDLIFIPRGFNRETIDFSKIPRINHINSLSFYECKFPQKSVDFSIFENCTKLSLNHCDLEHITGWPPKLKTLRLASCPKLLTIPTNGSNYQYLEEVTFYKINLIDWNINFSSSFYLRKIILENLLAYNPNQISANKISADGKTTEKPPFKIPSNWAYCINLEDLEIYDMEDMEELPIELTYKPRIYIQIIRCPKIPDLTYLPLPFWDCVDISINRKKRIEAIYEKYKDRYETCKKNFWKHEREWTRERVEYLKYVESWIPKMPEKWRECFREIVQLERPKVKTKKGYDIYL